MGHPRLLDADTFFPEAPIGHLMRFTQCSFTNAATRTRPTLRTDLPYDFSAFPPYIIRLRRLKNGWHMHANGIDMNLRGFK